MKSQILWFSDVYIGFKDEMLFHKQIKMYVYSESFEDIMKKI